MSFAKRLTSAFSALNSRERSLLSLAFVALLATGAYMGFEALQEHIADTNRLTQRRAQHLQELPRVLGRYKTLKTRLGKLQTTFAEAQMTFEEVTSQLDQIVRESIGSDNYDLKKGRTPTQIGFEYEKQEFTLKVKSLSLDQVVKLLHRLEQGESPLFLGKVDILKASSDDQFSATLEIFSVRKS